MKKKLLAFITAGAMLSANFAAFADEPVAHNDGDNLPAPEIQGDIMLINENPAAPEAVDLSTMNDPAVPGELPDPEIQGDAMLIDDAPTDALMSAPMSAYVSQTVTVTKVEDGFIEAVKDASIKEEDVNNIVVYNTSEETVVISQKDKAAAKLGDIKVGDTITGYTPAGAPAILMLPATYSVGVIVINNSEDVSFADVDVYTKDGESFINDANTLEVTVDENTKLSDVNGEKVEADALDGKALAVFYGASTRSIPAQTTATDIIVIGDAPNILIWQLEEDTVTINRVNNTVTVGETELEVNLYEKDGMTMVPLRAVAEALGFSVEWNGEIEAVTLNGGLYSLQIGENAYVAGRMMPEALACAPELTNDLTYVPAEFFSKILQMKLYEAK